MESVDLEMQRVVRANDAVPISVQRLADYGCQQLIPYRRCHEYNDQHSDHRHESCVHAIAADEFTIRRARDAPARHAWDIVHAFPCAHRHSCHARILPDPVLPVRGAQRGRAGEW